MRSIVDGQPETGCHRNRCPIAFLLKGAIRHAAQTARRATPARQLRDQDGRGIAHDNHIHLALPIDGEADLTPECA